MRTIPTFSALILSCVVAGLVLAAPAFELDFHSKVVAIYSFEPHKLTEAEMKAKSDELDQFWSSVKGDRQKYLPLLRRELTDPSNSAFFFYDGSRLLLSLSRDRSDQALAPRSIPKADLHGVQHTDYLQTIHWFARNGFDTREAAFRILPFPDFKAFIPQHALTLGQNYSLIYMLFPMDESLDHCLGVLLCVPPRLDLGVSSRSMFRVLLRISLHVGDKGVGQDTRDFLLHLFSQV